MTEPGNSAKANRESGRPTQESPGSDRPNLSAEEEATHDGSRKSRRSAGFTGAPILRKREPSTSAALVCSNSHALDTSTSGTSKCPGTGLSCPLPKVGPRIPSHGGRAEGRPTMREPRSGGNSGEPGGERWKFTSSDYYALRQESYLLPHCLPPFPGFAPSSERLPRKLDRVTVVARPQGCHERVQAR